MALEIEWSGRADKKFDKILEYLQEKWGAKATKTFVRKVYDFLDLVVEFPEMGTLEDKRKNIRGFTVIPIDISDFKAVIYFSFFAICF